MSIAAYFDQVPDWGGFAVVPDTVEGLIPSGRIPVVKVDGWRQLFRFMCSKLLEIPSKTRTVRWSAMRLRFALLAAWGASETRECCP